MLEIIGGKSIDWHQAWRNSPEYQNVKNELARLRALSSSDHANVVTDAHGDESQHQEFVASFSTQFRAVFVRTVKHFWRSPVYIWSKTILIVLYGLYLGFSYRANGTISGTTSQVWAIFMYFTLFINLNEQIMPMFVPQRAVYEARERPSKIYRWSTYVISNILVELGWNTLMAVIIFFCSYYAIDFVRNTNSGDQTERGGLFFLLLWQYMLFVSTFAHSAIVWIDLPEMASTLTLFLWMLCILFCGVPVPRNDLPGFWTFMNRVSPATYLVNGLASAAVANAEVRCAANEILHMVPAANQTCSDFLGPFSDATGGNVLNPSARDICSYCPVSNSNTMLAQFDIRYTNRWRDFGILWVYIFVNIGIALGFYWIFRVPKKVGTKKADTKKS
jgi:ABC-type multidrug transport system permease subunit